MFTFSLNVDEIACDVIANIIVERTLSLAVEGVCNTSEHAESTLLPEVNSIDEDLISSDTAGSLVSLF